MITIATPTATGLFTAGYVDTLNAIRTGLAARGMASHWLHVTCSDIVLGRNLLALRALADARMTHLLFVDSDMSFGAGVVDRLLGLETGLCGCVYPKRTLDLDVVQKHLTPGRTLRDAIALASDFVVRGTSRGPKVSETVLRVAGIGMGASLIRRDVFETMVRRGAVEPILSEQPYRRAGLKGPLHNFFALTANTQGEQLSEDFSFCERWTRDCGGEILAVTDADVAHVGEMRFTAKYRRYEELRTSIHSTVIDASQLLAQGAKPGL
jgi:hypothetical protein